MLFHLLILSIPFMAQFGILDGFFVGSGAFFTFGANSDKLQAAGYFFKVWYVIEAFLGVCLIALFVTVLANKWFSER